MVHAAATCKTAAQASMSAAAAPVSAAVGCVSASGGTAPYVYASTACPRSCQGAGLRLSEHQQGRPQQWVYPRSQLLCAPQSLERAPINAAPTPRHHPLLYVPRQLDGDSDDQNLLHTPGSALLQTNNGRASTLGAELRIQRRTAESIQRAHQAQAVQLQTQAACTLKGKCCATFAGAKSCLSVCPASRRQESLSPALSQSSTHEHVALGAQKHFQGTQHRQILLQEHLSTQQALTSQSQSFRQEHCILEHPQLKSQQQQATHQDLNLEEQRPGASPGGSQCKDMRQYSNPCECSVLKPATQRQGIPSPQGEAALRGSCEPQHQKGGRIEHHICQQQRNKWLLTFCDKNEALLFYTSKSTKARGSSTSCAADAGAPRCLTSAYREEPARAECSKHRDLLNADMRNRSRTLVQKGMNVARAGSLDVHKIANMHLTVGRIVTKPIQDVKAFPAAHTFDNEQFSDVRGLRGSLCQHGVQVQQQLSLPQQPLSCRNSEMINASGKGTEAHQPSRKVSKEGNRLMRRVTGVEATSEMAGDKIRCSSGSSGNATGEEIAGEEKARQCLIHSIADEPATNICGEMTAATPYKAEHKLPADASSRHSGPLRVLTPRGTTPRQDPGCRVVDTTAHVPTGGRPASTFNTRNTAIQRPHSAELNSASLLLHPALTEALLVPSTVKPARVTAACGEPPSLLAVHVAVVKPRIPNPTCAHESRGSTDGTGGPPRQESEPHAFSCNSRGCDGGCLPAGDSAMSLTHSEDSIGFPTLRSESIPVRSASSPGFLPGKHSGISGQRNTKSLCNTETTCDGSSSGRPDNAMNLIETSSCGRPSYDNNRYTAQTNNNYLSRLTVVASNTLSPHQVDNQKSLYVKRGPEAFEQKEKCTRVTQVISGEDSGGGRHHHVFCKQDVQPAIELFPSKTVQPCRKSAGQSKMLLPKSCPYSRVIKPTRCRNAISTDVPVNNLVLNPLASERAAVKGMLLQNSGGVQSPLLKRASEVADSGVGRVSLDCKSKSDRSVRARVPAECNTGCEEGKRDGLTVERFALPTIPDTAVADLEEASSPNAEGNESSCITGSPSAIEIIAAANMPAGAEAVASVVNTPAGSPALSTQQASAANIGLDILSVHSEAGLSCVSLADEQTADHKKNAATPHTSDSTNECFFEAHRSFSASTTSSRVNGSASTLGQARASVQQHGSQQLDTRQLFVGALTIPGPQNIHLPYLEVPVEASSSEAASHSPASVFSPLNDAATAYSFDWGHQNSASLAVSPEHAEGYQVGQEAQVTSQHVPMQLLPTPHFSDGSRVTSTLLESVPHQVVTQPERPKAQQSSADHRILQRPLGRHEWVKEEQTQSNQTRFQQQTNLEQSQQRTSDQLHQHQQQSCQSPDPVTLEASPTKSDTGHSQRRLHPEEDFSGLEALCLDACCYQSSSGAVNFDAQRSTRFRRMHSMSWCNESHRTSFPFVRAQRGATANRSKSLPSGTRTKNWRVKGSSPHWRPRLPAGTEFLQSNRRTTRQGCSCRRGAGCRRVTSVTNKSTKRTNSGTRITGIQQRTAQKGPCKAKLAAPDIPFGCSSKLALGVRLG